MIRRILDGKQDRGELGGEEALLLKGADRHVVDLKSVTAFEEGAIAFTTKASSRNVVNSVTTFHPFVARRKTRLCRVCAYQVGFLPRR